MEDPLSKFVDYLELADPLILPIHGKDYTIPPVGMADGIKFAALLKDGATDTDIDDDGWMRAVLGTAYDVMLEDDVPFPAVARAAAAAMADFTAGRAMAEVMWATGGDPKAVEAYLKTLTPEPQNRAQRRTRSTSSTSTGGAAKTPTRASTKVTTSPKG
jgi:hypothetical protein